LSQPTVALSIFLAVLAILATAPAIWIWGWTAESWNKLYTGESEVAATQAIFPFAFPYSLARSVPAIAVGAWLTVVAETILFVLYPGDAPGQDWLVLLGVAFFFGPVVILSSVVYFWGRPSVLVPPAARKPHLNALQLKQSEIPLIQESLELRESRAHLAMRTVVFLILSLVGVYVADDGAHFVFGWTFAIACLIGAFVTITMQVFWNRWCLRLTRQGFAWRILFVKRRYLWTEVGRFYRRPYSGRPAFPLRTSGREVTILRRVWQAAD
jgi:hypothetical protein